jgi:uncharacterized protein (DUF1810 family)
MNSPCVSCARARKKAIGFGTSSPSMYIWASALIQKYYGISGMEEAQAYMAHPVLGPRYLECVDALLEHRHRPIVEIIGTNLDAKKLLSSLTLIYNACGNKTIREAISAFYSGSDCEEEQRLAAKC